MDMLVSSGWEHQRRLHLLGGTIVRDHGKLLMNNSDSLHRKNRDRNVASNIFKLRQYAHFLFMYTRS
jgi:hypothetical protein